MAKAESVELSRAKNFRANLRRIFGSGKTQAKVANDSGIHFVHLSRITSGDVANPTIDTIEMIAIALEIPVETLLSHDPADADLRIFQKIAPATETSIDSYLPSMVR